MAMTSTENMSSDFFEGDRGESAPNVVFLTNRFNLLQILSSGLVGPRAAYDKYYDDLLNLAHGRVPLLAGPVDYDLLRIVLGGNEMSFPVALELDLTRVSRVKLAALKQSGGATTAPLGAAGVAAWAPPVVLPLAVFRRAVFRSASDLREHLARPYENVRFDAIATTVDPEVFSEKTDAGSRIVEWLKNLPAVTQSRAEFVNMDRVAGAKSVAAMTLPEAPAAAETVARLFGWRPDREPSSGATVAPWILAKTLTSANVAAGADLDERLFAAIVSVLRSTDRLSVWRPVDVLAAIEARMRLKKLSKKDDAELMKNVESIRGILRNEREFKSFTRGVGLPTAKALLMVLLRPEPDRLAKWPSAETGADDETRLTAGVFCGLLNGRERLPLAFRNAELDHVLAWEQAVGLATEGGGVLLADRVPTVQLVMAANGESGSLLCGDEVLVKWKSGPATFGTVLSSLDLDDAFDRQTAVDVSRIARWSRCVRTTISSDDTRVTIDSAKGRGLSLTVSGWPTISCDLDATEFRRHISQSFPQEFEEAARECIRGRSAEKSRLYAAPATISNVEVSAKRSPRR